VTPHCPGCAFAFNYCVNHCAGGCG
jgi:hypothetical protein